MLQLWQSQKGEAEEAKMCYNMQTPRLNFKQRLGEIISQMVSLSRGKAEWNMT